MAIICESRWSNSNDTEVDGPDESNSWDGDTNNTNFIVWSREKFGETHRKKDLLKNSGVNCSQKGTTQSVSSPELAK